MDSRSGVAVEGRPVGPAGLGTIRRSLPRLSPLPALLVATSVLAAPAWADERSTTPAEPPEDAATGTPAENATAVREQDDDAATTDPPPYSETVVVTATRDEEAIVDSVALVTALDAADLAESPGALVDETLARVPGFGLFRRNTSLISHPTTTGVSLRGLGPSGASRSLVLWDGIPLNDPFGNWIYWNRLPTLLLDRIEVARGGASPLYGSSALGGTIQLFSKSPAPLFHARARAGELGLRDGEVLASHRAGDFGFVGAARVFDSEGYHRIREAERGGVDEPAGVDFRSAVGRVEAGPVRFGLNYYREDRRNGTPVQVNDSRLLLLNAGIVRDAWSLDLFAQGAELNSDFSRILPGRDREIPTSQQHYEYSGRGGVFTARLGDSLLAGADWVRSAWNDHTQNRMGAFVQKRLSLTDRVEVLADGRFDLWTNAGTETSFNPRLGVRYRAADRASLRASAYRGFRAPSLNELYRPFRVGNVRVAANDELGEETLYGAEAGVDLYPNADVLVRANLFWNSLRDSVGNVTLEVNDTGVFRQRQNIGRAAVRGAEAEVRLRAAADLELFAAYLFSSATVEDTGLRLPQTPLHQGTVGFVWDGPALVRADLRFLSEQFEDDRNELPMAGFASLGVRAAYPIVEGISVYAAGENLLDAEIVSARTPIETLGTPRAVHFGLDFRFGR